MSELLTDEQLAALSMKSQVGGGLPPEDVARLLAHADQLALRLREVERERDEQKQTAILFCEALTAHDKEARQRLEEVTRERGSLNAQFNEAKELWDAMCEADREHQSEAALAAWNAMDTFFYPDALPASPVPLGDDRREQILAPNHPACPEAAATAEKCGPCNGTGRYVSPSPGTTFGPALRCGYCGGTGATPTTSQTVTDGAREKP